MSIAEQLETAHLLVVQTVDNLPEAEWEVPIAENKWTVKDIISHLASFEYVLVDVFNTFLEESPNTPYLSQYIKQHAEFNSLQVEERSNHTAQQVIDEYEEVQAQSTSLLARIPTETIEKKGTLPWYGKERSLGDLINTLSSHVKTHCNEITAFRNREKQ
jgi:uncharacterized damage-inducible protein DinB